MSETIGEKTRFTWAALGAIVSIVAVALGSMFSIKSDIADLKATYTLGQATIQEKLTSLEQRKLSRFEFALWTRDHQKDNIGNVKVEQYVPPPDGEKR